jgi:hypothetical protein
VINDPAQAVEWTMRFLLGLGTLLVLAWLYERRWW